MSATNRESTCVCIIFAKSDYYNYFILKYADHSKHELPSIYRNRSIPAICI